MKKFALLGKSLTHSISPTLHNHWYKKYKISAEYSLLETPEEKIQSVLKRIRNKELDGLNVTIPYKNVVIPFLDEVINDAEKTASVNTIYLNEKNKLVGENTDVFGLECALIEKLESSKNQSALILGAGGVTPSIIYALQKANINKIFVSNRTLKKVEEIKKKFSFINIISWEKIDEKIKDVDLLINATSLGTKGGEEFSNVFSGFKKSLVYYDVVYNPLQTKLMKHFIDNNIKAFNGLEMLIYQAQKAFYLWNKVNPEVDEALIKEMQGLIK
jgi:shikimate dehydrogenase